MLINCDDFSKQYQNEKKPKILLDVREPAEFASGSLKGAVNIPVGQLVSRSCELSKDKKIFIHCRSGGRAQKACDLLKSFGFKDVVVAVDGGFDDLKACGC